MIILILINDDGGALRSDASERKVRAGCKCEVQSQRERSDQECEGEAQSLGERSNRECKHKVQSRREKND